MTNKIILLIMSIGLTIGAVSCQKSNNNLSEASFAGNTEKRGGKKNNDNPPPPPPPEITYDVTYQLSEVDDPDPLYRFSISQSNQLILLETDPSITSWGTDYWGYWSSPFAYANGHVDYTTGLGRTIYTFTQTSATTIDVQKTLITSSYPSSRGGTTTTTVSHPGTYIIVP